jgi:hypothetical protein
MATEVWLCALHNSLSFSLANDAIIYSRFDIVLAATREPPRFIFYYFSSVSLSLTICHLHSISGPASRAAAPLLEIQKKKEEENCSFSSSLITPTRQRPTDRRRLTHSVSFSLAKKERKKERNNPDLYQKPAAV